MSKKSQSEILQEKLAKLNGNNAAQNPNQDEVAQAYEPEQPEKSSFFGNLLNRFIGLIILGAIGGVVHYFWGAEYDHATLQACYDERSESRDCKRQYRHAFKYAPKQCSQGNGDACAVLAVLYEDGVGTKQNENKALEYNEKACELIATHATESCTSLGNHYFLKNDNQKAAEYFIKACNAGNEASINGLTCAMVGTLYLTGDGIQQNTDLGKQYLEKACQTSQGKHGCDVLGSAYFEGKFGMPEDKAKALLYATQACDKGVGESCLIAGVLYLQGEGVEQNTATAMQYFEKGCQLGEEETSCYFIGSAYLTGLGVSEDKEKALTYLTQSCNAGNQDACSDKEMFDEE